MSLCRVWKRVPMINMILLLSVEFTVSPTGKTGQYAGTVAGHPSGAHLQPVYILIIVSFEVGTLLRVVSQKIAGD
ncbi:hypothetical protein EDC04DRAFT_1422266 [Pisolithus marmoratus]|nr:hypothetical protein EDC04DRAFT_1422266 [Pisolithus marmoratus]